MRHPGVLALPQDKTLVNLEGSIGAGKSTLRVLTAAYGGCSAVRFVDEPVAQWEGAGLLAALYGGKMAPAAFQLTAMVTRAAALKEALADPVAKVVISERSLASDRAVFVETQLAGADRDAYDLAYAAIDLPAVAARRRTARVSRRGMTRRVARRRRDDEKHVPAGAADAERPMSAAATLDRARRVDASARRRSAGRGGDQRRRRAFFAEAADALADERRGQVGNDRRWGSLVTGGNLANSMQKPKDGGLRTNQTLASTIGTSKNAARIRAREGLSCSIRSFPQSTGCAKLPASLTTPTRRYRLSFVWCASQGKRGNHS